LDFFVLVGGNFLQETLFYETERRTSRAVAMAKKYKLVDIINHREKSKSKVMLSLACGHSVLRTKRSGVDYPQGSANGVRARCYACADHNVLPKAADAAVPSQLSMAKLIQNIIDRKNNGTHRDQPGRLLDLLGFDLPQS